MSINPQKHDVTALFSIRKPYLIDFYQRDYKWVREHVKKLLEDIFYRFNLDYKKDSDVNEQSISKYDWYYLNTYVTNQYNGNIFLVDGQQRLTTLSLILIKLYHMTKQDRELLNINQVIKDRITGSTIAGYEFWMGYGGRKAALEDLFDNGKRTQGDSLVGDLSTKNTYQNYAVIDQELSSQLQNTHRISAFALYFLSRVMLVQIDIDNTNDVPMIFEVINDRGERLKPYEVLKGKLLGQIDKDEIDKYHDIWQEHIHRIQDIGEEDIDYFFRSYFRAKYIETHAEYREFDGDYHKTIYQPKWDKRVRLKQNVKGVKDFITNELSYYADLYWKIVEASWEKDSELGSYLFYNDVNDQDRQILLVMSACKVNDVEEDVKIELVSRLFDKHFSVLQLNGAYNSNNFTESLINLNKSIRNKSCSEIEEIYNRQILSDISKAKGVEVKDLFPWSYFKDANKLGLGDKFIRYYVARIDHFISENIKKPTANFYNLARNTGPTHGFHIEHIIAQNDENHKLFNDDEELFSTERNKLGALLLLRGRENEASGHEVYLKKLKTYAGTLLWNQTLCSDFYHRNKDLEDFDHKFGLKLKTYNVYDSTAIMERQRVLHKLTKKIWP